MQYVHHEGKIYWRDAGRLRLMWQKDGSVLPVSAPDRFRPLQFREDSLVPRWAPMRWFTDDTAIYVQAQQGSSSVYIYFYRIDNADLESFEVLNERYARDATRAYYVTGKTMRPREPARFAPLRIIQSELDAAGNTISTSTVEDEHLATDGCDLYVCGTRMKDVDAGSIRFLGGSYWIDAQHVYHGTRRIEAERASFVAVWQRFAGERATLWATDRHTPYSGAERQLAAGPALREEWAPFFAAHPELQDYWWHRSEREQSSAPTHRGVVLHGLDAARFAVRSVPSLLPTLSMDLCGDAQGIHCLRVYAQHDPSVPVTGALRKVSKEPISRVHVLGPGYWTDGKSVFLQATHYGDAQLLSKAHRPSFTVLAGGWAKDAARIYYCGAEKKGLEHESFQVQGSYAWDRTQLFCDGKIFVVDAQSADFHVPHPRFLLAGERLYCGRRPISAKRVHLPTLRFLDAHFARDRSTIYLVTDTGLETISEADPNSFAVSGPGVATDAARSYVGAELLAAWRRRQPG